MNPTHWKRVDCIGFYYYIAKRRRNILDQRAELQKSIVKKWRYELPISLIENHDSIMKNVFV